MKYKKGQIIPRNLVRCKSRKTQHLWTFGADVEVTLREITLLSDGVVFYERKGYAGGRHGKPRRLNFSYIHDIHVNQFVELDPDSNLMSKEQIDFINDV